MLYAILTEDLPGVLDKRVQSRPAHVERLKALQAEGRLILAGPHPAIDSEDPGPAGFTGSLIVAEFASREAAIAWASEDPYVKAGVYGRVTIKPFKKALPA
ncbi:hypothetical protein BWI17_22360 [Betaproteobacteria bacterium GR16-43]|nr:hypothetical protein BWI17_22360 [Betaproteobacteria bacterium GR16-43]